MSITPASNTSAITSRLRRCIAENWLLMRVSEPHLTTIKKVGRPGLFSLSLRLSIWSGCHFYSQRFEQSPPLIWRAILTSALRNFNVDGRALLPSEATSHL